MNDNFEFNDDITTSFFLECYLINQCGCENNDKYDKEEDCPICYESMHDEYVLKFPCGHALHRECFLEYVYVYGKTLCIGGENCTMDLKKSNHKIRN